MAEWQREREESKRAMAESAARLEALHAGRTAELEAGLRAIERGEKPPLPPGCEPSLAYLEAMALLDKMERAETRRRLEADAEKQWGVDWRSRPPSTPIRL